MDLLRDLRQTNYVAPKQDAPCPRRIVSQFSAALLYGYSHTENVDDESFSRNRFVMVALSEDSPQIAPAKPKGKRPPGIGQHIPLPVRLRVRNLYVAQGLSPATISKRVKLSAEQVQNLVSREGWTQERKRLAKETEELALARTREQLDEVVAAVGDLSEDASLAGLQRAVECTTKKSKFAAKDYASWANGARALVSIARQARGLEDKTFLKGGAGDATTINLYVGRFGPAVSEAGAPKNVTPSKVALEAGAATVDVAASAASDAPSK